MCTCSKCGHDNDDAQRFCSNCGTPLSSVEAESAPVRGVDVSDGVVNRSVIDASQVHAPTTVAGGVHVNVTATDSAFCVVCGKRMSPPDIRCPYCKEFVCAEHYSAERSACHRCLRAAAQRRKRRESAQTETPAPKPRATPARPRRRWWVAIPLAAALVAAVLLRPSLPQQSRTDRGSSAPQSSGLREDALLNAARSGDLSKVSSLVEQGADVNVSDSDGYTPLQWAGYAGHADVADALIAAGASIDAHDNTGRTALHKAAWEGQQEVARVLVTNGADVNVQDAKGYTPLHNAAYQGHETIVELLVGAGANVRAQTKDGRDVLQSAVDGGSAQVTALLRREAARR